MVEKMVNKHHEMNNETGTFFFRGVDNSIFDEQIYQKNHNLRGVFARKASGAPALCPILNKNHSFRRMQGCFLVNGVASSHHT
jgi:hypothetical protein